MSAGSRSCPTRSRSRSRPTRRRSSGWPRRWQRSPTQRCARGWLQARASSSRLSTTSNASPTFTPPRSGNRRLGRTSLASSTKCSFDERDDDAGRPPLAGARRRGAGVGVARRHRGAVGRDSLPACAPDRRAVDHGGRAHLLGAREELRRAQALALFPAVLTAPLLLGWRRVGRFRLLYGAVSSVAAVAVVAQAVRGHSPLALLGAYESVGKHGYGVGAVAKWLLWHLSELDLSLGVVPVAAFLVLALSWRSLAPPQRAFLAAASAISSWLILEVAAFASLPGVTRVEERDIFYVAPFFLIALLLWIELGAPRPRIGAPLVAACSAMLVAVLSFAKLVEVQPTADTLALVPVWRLHEHGLSVHEAWVLVSLAALAAAALFALVPRRFALALPLLLIA